MKSITLFSDGSSLGNPGPGGWASILEYKGKRKVLSGGEAFTTNNRMELKAVVEALKTLKEPCEVTLVSDSNYVVQAINEWLANWIKKGFKNVKNPDLWQEYIDVAKGHRVKGKWVRGHNGHPENEECDRLAKEEANRYKGV